jgi:hypothetical protein
MQHVVGFSLRGVGTGQAISAKKRCAILRSRGSP